MKWYIMVLKNYTKFTGRARRMEFWMFGLISVLVSIVASILDSLLGLNFTNDISSGGWIYVLYGLAVMIPSLAVTVRRFHDIGKSGWVYARFIIALIIGNLVGVMFMFMFMFNLAALFDMSFNEVISSPFAITIYSIIILYFSAMTVLFIWVLVLLFKDSQYGENKWGPNPKAATLPDTNAYNESDKQAQ